MTSRLGFSGVSRSVKTITIDQSTHTCYSLFQTCAAFLFLLAYLKQQPGVRVYISNISFSTLRTWLQCQRYAVIIGGLKNELCLCMAFPINTYLYILFNYCLLRIWNVRVAERLALPTSVHGVAGSNPVGGEILPEPKWCFIAQSLSCLHFYRPKMTEILLKGRKTITNPSIYWEFTAQSHPC